MPTKQNLMALGVHPFLADVQGVGPDTLTATGATVGSAAQVGPRAYLTLVNAGTSAIKMPAIGGDPGCLVGDVFSIVNMTAASLLLTAASNAAGSATALIPTSGTSVAGSTGLSIATGRTCLLQAATVSTWLVYFGASAL